ncbi:DUF3971 domain-containing protein [Roseicyclus elongatus]|uniref:DUF3971 domain-containing protein n=1 Tax=Roseicyclus elongatus TaxID=159346 RepID=UPI00046D5DBE|nr:DUF3971 domain-containing protein [Roseibacterium elongatum]
MDLRLTLQPEMRLEVGQAVIHDGDLRILADGEAMVTPEGLSVRVDAHVPGTDVDTVLGYWPVSAVPRTRDWVARRVQGGTLTGVDVALRRAARGDWHHAVQFDFADAVVAPFSEGPPLTDGVGYFHLEDARMVVRVDAARYAAEGQPQGISLAGSDMVIADLRQRPATAAFDLRLQGGLVPLMHALNAPPLRVLRAGTMTPERIGTGQVTARVRIDTSLARREAGSDPLAGVTLAADGAVTGYRSDSLVPGRLLEADDLTLTIAENRLAIAGRAAFDGVPVTGAWSRAIGPGAAPGSRLEARARLSRPALADLGIGLPDWLMAGQGMADLDLVLGAAGTPPRLSLRSDLSGLAMAIPALGWRLAPDRTGDLRAEIRLGPEPEVTDLRLEAGGLTLQGGVRLAAGGRAGPAQRHAIPHRDMAGCAGGADRPIRGGTGDRGHGRHPGHAQRPSHLGRDGRRGRQRHRRRPGQRGAGSPASG